MDCMNLEWGSSLDRFLCTIFDLVYFDGHSIMSLGNFLVQLARRGVNPIVVAILRIFAFVESFCNGSGSIIWVSGWKGLYRIAFVAAGRGEVVHAFLGHVSDAGGVDVPELLG